MKHALVLAACVAAAALGCGKKKSDDAPAKPTPEAKPAEPPPPPPPPAPYTGKLTVERVMGLDAAIGSPPPLALADALARAKGQAGEPTLNADGKIGWAVVEGDVCAYAYISASGDQVGGVTKAMKLGKDELPGNRAECLKMAGVEAGPPEDPNAAPPPADGSAVTVDVFRTAALAGRSKWKGQAVKVDGTVAGVSTSTAGDKSWTTVTLKAGDDDAGKPVSCALAENATTETKLGDHAVAAGTVKIQEWTSMGSGETTLEPALEGCTVEAAPKGKGKGKGK